jgi:hypothetical protein
MEASIDPAKTLGKDILPRFEKTAQYHKMRERVDYLNRPETAADLKVPLPEADNEVSQSLLKDVGYAYSLKVVCPDLIIVHFLHITFSRVTVSKTCTYHFKHGAAFLFFCNPQDILSEPHLYQIFYQYVDSLMSTESLLCIRLINIFEAQVTANKMKDADDTGIRKCCVCTYFCLRISSGLRITKLLRLSCRMENI